MNTEPDIKNTTSDAINNIQFADVLNIEDIQRLQDLFSDASGVASIIIHPDGIPITNPGNFCRLCNREDFMEALNEVPVMSVEQLNKVSKMLFPGM